MAVRVIYETKLQYDFTNNTPSGGFLLFQHVYRNFIKLKAIDPCALLFYSYIGTMARTFLVQSDVRALSAVLLGRYDCNCLFIIVTAQIKLTKSVFRSRVGKY